MFGAGRSLLACGALLTLACASAPGPLGEAEPAGEAEPPTLILISLDGFRWDFLDRGLTPTLSRLASEGVHAGRLVPSFPTKTYPNHYTVVTGLRPSEHGLVANNIWDPIRKKRFGLSDRESVGEGAWYGGEPIWVTAERHGVRTAPLFWPGSEAEIKGVRPTFSRDFDRSLSPEARVDLILEWIDLPEPERPGFLTLYFETVDDAAHEYGPEPSDELATALRVVDGVVERLLAGLERRDLGARVDLLIVSDHGMSSTSRERVILLDDYVDIDLANVVDWNPILGLWPSEQNLDAVFEALEGAHPHLAVYRRDQIPARFEFAGHERIPPILGIADDGWSIAGNKRLSSCTNCFAGGSHGYDQRAESMGALLIAHGPSFRSGVEIREVDNVDLYNVMCAVLGLEPAENSGDPRTVPVLVETLRDKGATRPRH